jgi:hypothetical protein
MDPPLLEFDAGRRNIDPVNAFAVLGYKPYRVPENLASVPKIHVLGPAADKKCQSVTMILQDLREGKMGTYARSKYKPFLETFRFDVEPQNYEEYEGEPDVYRKITEVSQYPDKNSHVIVVISPEKSQLGGFYYHVKKISIEKGVQTQIILKKTVENYANIMNDNNRGDFQWNFSFGIFSKLGGTPWKLDRVLDGVSAFISLNTVTSFQEEGIIERKGIVALELANCWGDPIGRFFSDNVKLESEEGVTYVDLKTIDTLMKKALDQIEGELANPEESKERDYVIIHVQDRYADSVYNRIAETIKAKGFKKFKIIHIQEQGPLRLYDTASLKQGWPRAGTYWYLVPGNIAFLYTIGRWQYSVSEEKEPYIIGARDVSPLQVNYAKGSEGSKLSDDDLRHIYSLTRLHYYSADIPRIKMPFTVRLGARAAHLAASGLTALDFPISFLY